MRLVVLVPRELTNQIILMGPKTAPNGLSKLIHLEH